VFFVPADVEQSHGVSVSADRSCGKGPGKCLSYGDFTAKCMFLAENGALMHGLLSKETQ
jgi:hypothetical protein